MLKVSQKSEVGPLAGGHRKSDIVFAFKYPLYGGIAVEYDNLSLEVLVQLKDMTEPELKRLEEELHALRFVVVGDTP